VARTPAAARQRRDLTLGEVVDEATRIMRDEGAATVTMRHVADACGVTPMALYHYVANKEDLLTLVVDRVIEPALDDDWEQGTWRDAMLRFARSFRALFLDNPGAGAVFVRRPVVSPNQARVTERLFAILDRGGVSGAAAAEAVDAIVLLTIGSIANDLTRAPDVREQLVEQIPTEEIPLTNESIGAYAHRDPEQRYLLALGWLLDGIERGATG
jgi:TetR/AcrR family tetracycline transcriptional repressor